MVLRSWAAYSVMLGLQESPNKGFGIRLALLLFLPFDYNLTVSHVSLLHLLGPLLCRNDNLSMSLAFLHHSPVTSQEDKFQNKHRLVGSWLQSSPQKVAATGMSSERLAELPGQVYPQLWSHEKMDVCFLGTELCFPGKLRVFQSTPSQTVRLWLKGAVSWL